MRELQVRNRQRERAVNIKFLRELTRVLLDEELRLSSYELGIAFISAARMAAMNQQYLGHEGSTDVITFDYREGYERGGEDGSAAELAGEIYISVADARRQAREFSTSWQEELVRYMVHGVLHLRGFDDSAPANRKVMKREEKRLVRQMRAQFDVREIGR
ncbi:MAG: rRNA maturation RNase YbeY [Limisphaerales bacterium]